MEAKDITPAILDDLEKFAKEAGVNEMTLDDEVHDAKSSEAADINNSGIRGQLQYLLEGYKSVDAFKKWLIK